MPKLKTHKATAKRVKARANGFKRRNAYATHLLGHKTSKRKRKARRNEPVSPANMENVRHALLLK